MGGIKMTREQQIIQASIEYTIKTRPVCIGGDAFSELVDKMNRNHAFEEGAKWADKTIIDKACEYAKARYDLDYCGNVMDILNYLKSLVEE